MVAALMSSIAQTGGSVHKDLFEHWDMRNGLAPLPPPPNLCVQGMAKAQTSMWPCSTFERGPGASKFGLLSELGTNMF